MIDADPLIPKWLTTLGLVLDLVAVWIVALSVIVTRDQAYELSAPRFNSPPAVESDRIQASTKATVGGLLFSVGIALQVIATWIR